MFSTGQWIFALLFFIAFVTVIAVAYRRDLKLHQRYYRGTVWILIAFIGFIALIATIKFIFM